MKRLEKRLFSYAALAAAILLLAGTVAAQPATPPPIQESVTTNAVTWTTTADWASARLTVLGPNGFVLQRTFQPGDTLELGLADLGTRTVVDGSYTYELRFAPRVDSDTSARLAAARAAGSRTQTVQELRREGALPTQPLVRSGALRVVDGSFVPRDLTEDTAATSQGTATVRGNASMAALNQVINQDLEVQGSECVGFDCTSSENFGYDTIRLKENNTQINFNDTSTSPGFPSENWTLRANSHASGGRNAFFIDDNGPTGNGTPFTVMAGAPTNAFYVASNGRVGFGTSTPVLRLQTTYGDTPGLRLEQTASLGWSAQTWDIAGNETNFFVRDVTHNSHLPFRIRPGAPTSSIDIAASGDVGIGTSSPSATLDVNGDAHVSSGAQIDGSVGIGTDTQSASLDVTGDAHVDGNVGVGTTSPFAKLDVNGSAHVSGDTHIDGSTYVNGDTKIDGNVGIGTVTPSAKLDVNGSAHVSGNAQVNGDTHIGGNVGIGTSTPSAKLDVVGGAHIAGNIVQDGGATVDGQDLTKYEAGVIPASAFRSMGTSHPSYLAIVRFPATLNNYTVTITPVTTNLTQVYRVVEKSSDRLVVGTDSISGLTEVDWQVRPMTAVH